MQQFQIEQCKVVHFNNLFHSICLLDWLWNCRVDRCASMGQIISSISGVWIGFDFVKSCSMKANLLLSYYYFMESPPCTKRHRAPQLHVPFNQNRHVSGIREGGGSRKHDVSGIREGGGSRKHGEFVLACRIAWSLSTNLSFDVLGGSTSNSLIGMPPVKSLLE